MKIVIIESPYAGNIERNVAYALAAMRDSLLRGEAPYASHLLYTQDGVLDDGVQEQREIGLAAGWAFAQVADVIAVYADLGISEGMQRGIDSHLNAGFDANNICYRYFRGEWGK